MRGIMRGLVAGSFVAIVLGGLGLATGYDWLLGPAGTSSKVQLFVVKPGTPVAVIAHDLETRHLIKSDNVFRIYLRMAGLDREIKAGAYALAPAMGARGIAKELVAGRDERTRVTVPEGCAIAQMAKRLEARQKGAGDRFRTLVGRPDAFVAEFPWLKQLTPGASLEGFLFPDTYVVNEGAEGEQSLVRLMLSRFEQVGMLAYQKRQPPASLTLGQWVTMASIVEKEARKPAEREVIAGVFYNRLAQRIPFGSDPTVEYALGWHQDAKGLTLRDVQVDSPYNTYRHAGLPPGPIASPGLASLLAALQPARTPYMYFVARGDGSHVFTRTYAEHLAAQREVVRAAREHRPGG